MKRIVVVIWLAFAILVTSCSPVPTQPDTVEPLIQSTPIEVRAIADGPFYASEVTTQFACDDSKLNLRSIDTALELGSGEKAIAKKVSQDKVVIEIRHAEFEFVAEENKLIFVDSTNIQTEWIRMGAVDLLFKIAEPPSGGESYMILVRIPKDLNLKNMEWTTMGSPSAAGCSPVRPEEIYAKGERFNHCDGIELQDVDQPILLPDGKIAVAKATGDTIQINWDRNNLVVGKTEGFVDGHYRKTISVYTNGVETDGPWWEKSFYAQFVWLKVKGTKGTPMPSFIVYIPANGNFEKVRWALAKPNTCTLH